MRKKTPEQINAQLVKIMEYYFIKTDRADEVLRKNTSAFIEKLSKVAWGYIDNIYKLAGIPNYQTCNADVSNHIWFYRSATKAEYAK